MTLPKIPTRIKNRMEKWTAFSLVVIALIYTNIRVNNVEKDYKDCMESRVEDAKQLTNNIYHHEKKKQAEAANPEIFPQATQWNDRNRSDRRGRSIGPGLIASLDHDRRRLRGSDRHRWRFRFAAN